MDILETNYNIIIKNVLYRFKTRKNYKEDNRKTEGFIFYTKGGHSFHFTNTTIKCLANQFIYLPQHSAYSSKLLSDDTEYYELDFKLYINNNPVTFGNEPFILSEDETEELFPIIKKLYDNHCISSPLKHIKCLGYFCNIFTKIKSCNLTTINTLPNLINIQKSVSYIEKNYNLNTSIKEIAEMSYMSVSNLEKNFRMKFKVSPLMYRNNLRIDKSKALLLGGKSIKDTALEVGFSDVYYFSKIFKKITGTTPNQFIKTNEILI